MEKFKNVTNIAILEMDGQYQLAYSYDEIDVNTGKVIRDNIQERMVILPISRNNELLESMKLIEKHIENLIN